MKKERQEIKSMETRSYLVLICNTLYSICL